jgi:hypothetical protein
VGAVISPSLTAVTPDIIDFTRTISAICHHAHPFPFSLRAHHRPLSGSWNLRAYQSKEQTQLSLAVVILWVVPLRRCLETETPPLRNATVVRRTYNKLYEINSIPGGQISINFYRSKMQISSLLRLENRSLSWVHGLSQALLSLMLVSTTFPVCLFPVP